MWVHRTMIVPAAYAPLARALAEGIAGPSGAGMFKTALSASGQLPATHYISAGMIQDEFAALLESPQAIAQAAQGAVTVEQAAAMLAASSVTDGVAKDEIEAMGLQMIVEGLA